MRTNVILIDFESVQPESIEALNEDHFRVFLFCGANQNKVPFAVASTLQKLGTRALYVKISGTGPNALDFHIAYYIGRIAEKDPEAFFHIVSRDKGFDPLIRHLKESKILSARSESIADIPILRNGARKSSTERAEAFIAKLREPKVTKPRTERTMCSAIRAHFQPVVDASEATQILAAMASIGFISIESGKIVYAAADA